MLNYHFKTSQRVHMDVFFRYLSVVSICVELSEVSIVTCNVKLHVDLCLSMLAYRRQYQIVVNVTLYCTTCRWPPYLSCKACHHLVALMVYRDSKSNIFTGKWMIVDLPTECAQEGVLMLRSLQSAVDSDTILSTGSLSHGMVKR